MARTKIKELPNLKSWSDVDEVFKEVAEREIKLEKIEIEMNRKINLIKSASTLEAKEHQERIDMLGRDIKEFVSEHKEDLDGKTKVLNFGKTGFRLSTKLSIPVAKDKVQALILKLRKRTMDDCINIKETINKEVLKKYDETTIVELGGKLTKKDEFWYETDCEKLKHIE